MSQKVQIGYGKSLLEYDTRYEFRIKLPKLTRMPLTPFEEARLAAKEISNSLPAPPVLCLSGGIDSEAMALAFLAEGLPFRVASMYFNDSLNEHDVENAIEFCKIHKLKHDLIHLDIVKFFENGTFNNYVDKYICQTPELAAQLWFLEQIEQPFVWAAEAFRIYNADENPSIQAVSELEAAVYRYVSKNNLNSVPNFHFYSAELAWSFFKESLKANYKTFADDHDPGFYEQKFSFYLSCGFPIRTDSKRSQKLHGFENVKNYFDQKLKSEGHKDDYNSFYRRPVADRYPLAKTTYVDISKEDIIAGQILRKGKSQ